MIVHVPAQVFRQGLVDSISHQRQIDGDMVLLAVLADVAEQLLEVGNLHHAVAAKGIDRVIR